MKSNLGHQDEQHLKDDVAVFQHGRMRPEELGEDSEQQAALAKIKIMLDRERSSYSIQDYEDSSQDSSKPFSHFVTLYHRKRMVEWCLAMVGPPMQMRRETVERAINYVDRFVLLSEGKILLSDHILYERAIITALYIMIKCHEEEVVPIKEMAYVCSGGDENGETNGEEPNHTAEQLASMEIVLLTELQWSIAAPASAEYIVQFLKLLNLRTDVCEGANDRYDESIDSSKDESIDESIAETKWLLELANFEVEQSLQDYDCWKKGAFHNAYKAVLNALPMINGGEEMVERLNAILLTQVPGMDQYRSSGSTSDVSTDAPSTPKMFRKYLVETSRMSFLSSNDSESAISSASSTSTTADDSSILSEEDSVETTVTAQGIFTSCDDIVPLGDAKIGVDDNESPACVMGQVLSAATQIALMENNSEMLTTDDDN